MSQLSLYPLSKPVALFEEFIATQPQTLVLKERIFSLTGDSFEIKFDNGAPFLKVTGAWPSFSGRKKVEDMRGNHLFDICKEHMHIHTTYVMKEPDGNTICEVKNSHKIIGSKATTTFTDPGANEVTLTMSGNWMDHIANVVEEQTGETVARISRKLFTARHMFFGKDNYSVIVAPGVDMALIAGLCICFDEKNND
ncbi:unnamed protein product [Penicillium pancosmium]